MSFKSPNKNENNTQSSIIFKILNCFENYVDSLIIFDWKINTEFNIFGAARK